MGGGFRSRPCPELDSVSAATAVSYTILIRVTVTTRSTAIGRLAANVGRGQEGDQFRGEK